jgi:tRNA threonylcarbamoyladenosine biosynthesis protein TsaB
MRGLGKSRFVFGNKIALPAGNGTSGSSAPACGGDLNFAYTLCMHLIAIDTADARGSVGVFADHRLLHLESHTTDEDYSSWLLPAVHRSLSSTSLSLAELDGYAVCSGPGSFTGLRVGLTTVKAWAELYNKPTIGVSRLEGLAMAGGQAADSHQAFVAVVFDARRDQVFAALYRKLDGGLAIVGEEQVIGAAEFVERVIEETAGQPVLWRTPDEAVLTRLSSWEGLAGHRHVLESIAPPFVFQLAALALGKLRDGETKDALSLEAEYVRRSDAEIFWKGNKSAFRP